ncbi:MAG TPA: hypothetical protein VGB30_09215 [bacterium]|jgi:hypothetical protein
MSEKPKGDIPMHDRDAIRLHLLSGAIGLHPVTGLGKYIGIDIKVAAESYRSPGMSSGFLIIGDASLTIPSPYADYEGYFAGWELYDESGYYEQFKPEISQLLPHHKEYTTFAFLDGHDEIDPYFYYGWGKRVDHMPPFGTRNVKSLAHFGVNYPRGDLEKPSWGDIPSQDVLKSLLQKFAPKGEWTLEINTSGFTVDNDPGIKQTTVINFSVTQGEKYFHETEAGYVFPENKHIGVKNAGWEGIKWSVPGDKGTLRMLSGSSKGKIFTVESSFYTGDDPDPGYPANTWFIETTKIFSGVKPGDEFILIGPYNMEAHGLVSEQIKFKSPGNYLANNYSFSFTPIF